MRAPTINWVAHSISIVSRCLATLSFVIGLSHQQKLSVFLAVRDAMLLRYLLHRLVNREDANRGALRATSAAGMYWPVQRRALRRRSLPARPARRLRAQRRPMWSASQRCCFKHRALRALFGRNFLRTRTVSAGAARLFSWLAAIESYCLLTFHRAPLAAAPQTAAAALISACETAHVPATLLRRLPLRTKCVAVAVAGTWQLGRSPWQWLSWLAAAHTLTRQLPQQDGRCSQGWPKSC